MCDRRSFCAVLVAASLFVLLAKVASGQEPAVRNIAEMKFVAVSGLLTCALGALQTGDLTKEASIILAKMVAGCTIPWHWHTPNEHLPVSDSLLWYGYS
jgi:hypothetical protein